MCAHAREGGAAVNAEEKAVGGVGAPRLVRFFSSILYVSGALSLLGLNNLQGELVELGEPGSDLVNRERRIEDYVCHSDTCHDTCFQRWDILRDASVSGYISSQSLGVLQLGSTDSHTKLTSLPSILGATTPLAYKIDKTSSSEGTKDGLHVTQEFKNEGKAVGFGHIGLWVLGFFLQVAVGVLLAALIVKGGMYQFYKWWDTREWNRIYGCLNSPTRFYG